MKPYKSMDSNHEKDTLKDLLRDTNNNTNINLLHNNTTYLQLSQLGQPPSNPSNRSYFHVLKSFRQNQLI